MMTPAEKKHRELVEKFPLYKETAHWTPVLCKVSQRAAIDRVHWAYERGLVRGDRESRNDYLVPVSGLWLFKDPKVAVEFKLIWGGDSG